MKKAINLDCLYLELPFYHRFEAASKDGFQFVEMWYHHNRDIKMIKRLLTENNLAMSGMNADRYYSLCDPDHRAEYIDEIKSSVEIAKMLDLTGMAIHSNVIGSDGKAVDDFSRFSNTVKTCTILNNLKEIARIAEDAELTLYLEPLNTVIDHAGNYLSDTQTAAELAACTGSQNIKVLFDAYHMYLSEEPICETFSRYFNQIGYVHIADAPGRHEPGTGSINYNDFFKTLKNLNFDGFVSFELFAEKNTSTAVQKINQICNDFL